MTKITIITRFFAALFAAAIFGGGCAGERPVEYVRLEGFALGTTYRMVAGFKDSTGMQKAVDSLFAAVDASMSVFEENSLLNRVNRNETDSLDKHLIHCIEAAAAVSEISGGRYDITIRPLTRAWGFNAEEAQRQPDVDSLLQFVGYRKIRIENGRLVKENPWIEIDLNSIAKGYTVDLLGELLREMGSENYLVEVGGEIVCRGTNPRGTPWTIGIDTPEEGNYTPGASLQTILMPGDAAMATSGDYRNFYIDGQGRKIAHTINALTGMTRGSDLLSATVVAPDCTTADAYATMLMVVGRERAIEILESNPDIAGYLISAGENGEYKTYVSAELEQKILKVE